jgi:hypothetical protein
MKEERKSCPGSPNMNRSASLTAGLASAAALSSPAVAWAATLLSLAVSCPSTFCAWAALVWTRSMVLRMDERHARSFVRAASKSAGARSLPRTARMSTQDSLCNWRSQMAYAPDTGLTHLVQSCLHKAQLHAGGNESLHF